MRKSIIIMALLFLCKLSEAQTTEEEYNYLTKGYKVQIESGLDMKKGYSMVDYGYWGLTSGSEERNCTFKGLIRQGQTKPCAILMIYKRTDIENGANFYVCIPDKNSDDSLWQRTLDFMNTNLTGNATMMETCIWGLMKFASWQSTQ